MRTPKTDTTWVVYRMTLLSGVAVGNVVCEQWEWDALQAAKPGYHTLLYSGIKTEQEAEKLARGTAGETPPRNTKPKTTSANPTPPALAP